MVDPFRPKSKPFRRKRVSEGKDWKPTRFPYRNDPDYGPYCKACKKRHPWDKVVMRFELRQGVFHILMYCPTYGDMIEDKELRRA